jgi:hypothetical protein
VRDLWSAGLPLQDYNEYLRSQVLALGLPHSAFAKKVGIHKAAWLALVQGKPFKGNQFDAVADALHLTLEQLGYAVAPERHCAIPKWGYGGIEGSIYCTVCPETLPDGCDMQCAKECRDCPCRKEMTPIRIDTFIRWVAEYGHDTGILEVISPDEPRWLTSSMVAERYGISPRWARHWMKKHYQHTFKAGKDWLVDPLYVRDHPWRKKEEE